MALRFVLGRAGSGKTRHCLSAVAAELAAGPDGPPLILLVPEQATFQVERALLAGVAGFARAHVLSFRRLAWRVLQASGGAARPTLGALGRTMVLRSILASEAERLRIFGRVADRPGFIDRLSNTLTELADYRVDLAGVQLAAEGTLGAKLHDLAIVQERYRAYLAGRFTDPDGQLDLLADLLPEAALARGARVWVDGFAGFTPQELRALEILVHVADEVQVALLLDPDRPSGDEADPFHPTQETRAQLLGLGVPVAEAIELRQRPRFRAPALAHLERQFLEYPGERFSGPPDGLRLVAAGDRRSEIEGVASEILRLVREEGYRFRDVAVVARDLDVYADPIAVAFRSAGIPFFTDRRRPVAHHPLVELLRSALEVIAGRWPYEAVFRYLKTDLVPVARDEVDRLEEYVLEFGIRGSRWTDGVPWCYRRRFTLDEDEEERPREQARLAEVNRIRETATAALARFQSRVGPAAGRPRPVPELTAALYALLEDLGVPERVGEWSREAEAEGALARAQEHLQVWQGVVEILDQTVESLPEVELGLGEYLRVIEAGLDGLRVGLVPPGLDQVLVGGVERSRHPSLRAAFVVGASDGAYPLRSEEDVVFSDAERAELSVAGVDVGPGSRVRALHEQYLAYVALTRAGDRLWVSHPLADEDGRGLAPAGLVRRLRALFPGAAPERRAAADGDPAAISTPPQLIAELARQLRRLRAGDAAGDAWLDVYQAVVADEALSQQARPILAALGYRGRGDRLAAGQARRLYGEAMLASVSQLESFGACAFQHFAAYGLRLRERQVRRLSPSHLGQFYHAALSLLARDLEARGLRWAALDRVSATEMVDAAVGRIGPRLADEILTSSARLRHVEREARRTLESVALTLAEHDRRGRFRPAGVEVGFGPEAEDRLPPLRFVLPGGARLDLRGRIDRVDVARVGGRRLLRVLDYKSSPRDLRLDRLYHGLALQLGLYLLAAVRGWGEEVEPAGLLYLPVHDPIVAVERPDAPRPNVGRTAGWVLDDPDALAAMDETLSGELVPVRVRKDGRPYKDARVAGGGRLWALFGRIEERVGSFGAQLLDGRVEAAPYRADRETPCRFCPFRPVCAFDPLVPGNDYRLLPKLPAEEVWRRLGV